MLDGFENRYLLYLYRKLFQGKQDIVDVLAPNTTE